MKLEDIKKLADLARIYMSEEEMIEIAKDFDPILAYVGQVQNALKSNKNTSEGKEPEDHTLYNVMREDVPTNNRNEYTDKILSEMPETQDGFLKVKQIL